MDELKEDRIFKAIAELGGKFEDFKTEFNVRMYIGNGKPAVMTELKNHADALEELNLCLGKTNNKILLLEENVKPILKEREIKEEAKGFIKNYWKWMVGGLIVLFIILLLILAGIVYTASKLPNVDKLAVKVMAK